MHRNTRRGVWEAAEAAGGGARQQDRIPQGKSGQHGGGGPVSHCGRQGGTWGWSALGAVGSASMLLPASNSRCPARPSCPGPQGAALREAGGRSAHASPRGDGQRRAPSQQPAPPSQPHRPQMREMLRWRGLRSACRKLGDAVLDTQSGWRGPRPGPSLCRPWRGCPGGD